MNRLIVIAILLLCIGGGIYHFFGGKEEATQAEKQAEKVKEFRVRQKKMAIKAYEDLATKYPDSEFAPQAKERLQQIAPPAAPKK